MKTKHYLALAALAAVIVLVVFLAPGPTLGNNPNSLAAITNVTNNNPAIDLPQSVRDLVNKELVTPLRKKHYGSDKPSGREFSRCPSGIHANFDNTSVSAKDGYFHGEINKWGGCDSQTLCTFRANSTTVQVETNDSGFISAEDWLNRAIAKKGTKEI